MYGFRTSLVLVTIFSFASAVEAIERSGSLGREAFLPLIKREAAEAGLPWSIADAVVFVESGYDPTRVGTVGELGLMQVRPTTAAVLGFSGSGVDLMRPEINIHYGVTYLAGAWRLAGGDLCRTLMKYRAGHGEDDMTLRSVDYCARARGHIAAIGQPIGGEDRFPATTAMSLSTSVRSRGKRMASLNGTALRGSAFWAVHDARVQVIRAKVERHWGRFASR